MGDKPDSKCIFTYVQSLYKKFKDFEENRKEKQKTKEEKTEKRPPPEKTIVKESDLL